MLSFQLGYRFEQAGGVDHRHHPFLCQKAGQEGTRRHLNVFPARGQAAPWPHAAAEIPESELRRFSGHLFVQYPVYPHSSFRVMPGHKKKFKEGFGFPPLEVEGLAEVEAGR